MQSDQKLSNNLSKITNVLKICNKLIKTLFIIEVKYFEFNKCEEVEKYMKNEKNDLNYDNSMEFNSIILLFLRFNRSSNFISNLEEDDRKSFRDFLEQSRKMRNKVFHEETYKITSSDLKDYLGLVIGAINLINKNYAKYKILKFKYLEYLTNLLKEI